MALGPKAHIELISTQWLRLQSNMRFWKSRSKNWLKKLSTCLPHSLHHCPPPTYSPYSSSTELCVRHTAQVLPQVHRWEAKKLRGEGYNSSRPPWFYEPRDVPFICCSDMSPTHAACFQPHCSCYHHSQHQASSGTSQWDKVAPPSEIRVEAMAANIFFPDIKFWGRYHCAFRPSDGTFTAGQVIVPQLKNTRMWMQIYLPQNLFAILERAVGPALSCQQGHTQNTALSCMNKRRTNLWK